MGQTASRIATLLAFALTGCSLAGPGESPSAAARARAFSAGVASLEGADFDAAVRQLATVSAICPVDGIGRRSMLLLAAAELDSRNDAGRPGVAAELAAFQLTRPSRSDSWSAPMARQLYVLALDHGADSIPAATAPGAEIIWSAYLQRESTREPVGAERESAPDSAAPAAGAAQPPAGAAAQAPVEQMELRRTARETGGPLCEVPPPQPGIAMPLLDGPSLAARVAAARSASADAAPSAQVGDVRALQAEVERLRGELAQKEQELDRIRRTLRP